MIRMQMLKMMIVVMVMIHRPFPESSYMYALSAENPKQLRSYPVQHAIGN